MRMTQMGGRSAINNDSLDRAEKIEGFFLAQGAILVGSPVSINFAGAATVAARSILATATATADAVIGIYEGLEAGGTGPLNSTLSPPILLASGAAAPGQAAASGDVVLVTLYGEAFARVDGGTTDLANGNNLGAGVTTAVLTRGGTLVTNALAFGFVTPFVYMGGTYTSATVIVERVFCRCM